MSVSHCSLVAGRGVRDGGGGGGVGDLARTIPADSVSTIYNALHLKKSLEGKKPTMVNVTVVSDDLPLDGGALDDGSRGGWGRRRGAGARRRLSLSLHHNADALTIGFGGRGPRPPPFDDAGINVHAHVPLRGRRPVRDNVSWASPGERPRTRRADAPGTLDISLPDQGLGRRARAAGCSPVDSLDLSSAEDQGTGLGPPTMVLTHEVGDTITLTFPLADANIEVIIVLPDSNPRTGSRWEIPLVQVAATGATVRHGGDGDDLPGGSTRQVLFGCNDQPLGTQRIIFSEVTARQSGRYKI